MDFGEFFEQGTLVPAFVPVDMQTGANNGDWVSMANYNRMVAVLFKAKGTAGDDPVFTLNQAKDNAGTGSKALNFTRIREKISATAVTGVNDFTLATQAAAGTFTDLVSAESEGMIAVDVKAADLDVQGGFAWVQMVIPDVGGNAQLGCGFYMMFQTRFAQATPPEAIA